MHNGYTDDLILGSPEHKAQRWEDYKGDLDYNAWSKKYDVCIQNNSYGLKREAEYRDVMNGENKVIKTPTSNRQIDIYKGDDMYIGQLKTGKVYHGEQAKIDLEKDAWLVEQQYTVEYILEGGASKPFLDKLDELGIKYKIGSQIP